MPTFEHGQLDALVADLIVALLNQQLRDYTRTTLVTLQVPDRAGIEPDHCFWIERWQAVSWKKRIDRIHPLTLPSRSIIITWPEICQHGPKR